MEKFRNGFRQHKTLMMKHLFRILVYHLFSHLELGVYSLLWSFAEGDKLFGPMNRGSTLCGVAMMMIMMSSIIKHYSNLDKNSNAQINLVSMCKNSLIPPLLLRHESALRNIKPR